MPYPKRRSCTKCVQAKRKCNLGFPRCQRCIEKDIVCLYQVEPTTSTTANSSATPIAENPTTEPATSSFWPSPMTLQRLPAAAVEESTFSMDLAPLSGFDTSIDWLANITTPPSLGFDELIDRPSLIKQIEEDDTVMTGDIYMPRVHYVAVRMKTWSAMFAQRSTTPFIHRSFFSGVGGGGHGAVGCEESEDVMLEALSTCALYATGNRENGRAVFELVRRKATRLVEGKGDGKWKGPGELLASLQALLLYQIIRLFDGDIRLRADAEVDAVVQVRWTVELLKYFRPLRQLDTMVDQFMAYDKEMGLAKRIGWQEWVFDESVRRTILTSYMIQGVYSFLKEGMDPVCGRVEKLSFTAQKELWEAPSEFHWNDVWTKKSPCEIRMSQWENDAANICVDDFDELGVIMMVTLKDLDLTAEWLGKENLVRYGLDLESMNKYLR